MASFLLSLQCTGRLHNGISFVRRRSHHGEHGDTLDHHRFPPARQTDQTRQGITLKRWPWSPLRVKVDVRICRRDRGVPESLFPLRLPHQRCKARRPCDDRPVRLRTPKLTANTRVRQCPSDKAAKHYLSGILCLRSRGFRRRCAASTHCQDMSAGMPNPSWRKRRVSDSASETSGGSPIMEPRNIKPPS